MNLDELQSVQARERQSSDLQHLRSSFYREVGEYVQELSTERDRLVEAAEDPFSSAEVRQLTDDIETAEQTVEAIYERRVGKVVKKASIAAAGMPVDDDGLTEEEETLFEDLVARIEGNRETVLAVLDGETPDLSGPVDAGVDATGGTPASTDPSPESEAYGSDPATDAEPAAGEGVSAADLMGVGPDADTETDAEGSTDDDTTADVPAEDPLAADPDDEPTEVPPEPGPPGGGAAAGDAAPEPSPSDGSTADEATGGADSADDGRPSATSADRDVPGIPRTTVRITTDVGEVVGADDRDYDLGPEDVVTLPEPNADVLVEKDAAERLE
jgi:DNA replication factor GINS